MYELLTALLVSGTGRSADFETHALDAHINADCSSDINCFRLQVIF